LRGSPGAHPLRRIDLYRTAAVLGGIEGNRLKQPFHDRMEAARTDVLGALIDLMSKLGDAAHTRGGVFDADRFGRQQRPILRRQ